MKKVNSIFAVILLVFLSTSVGYYFGVRGYEVKLKREPINFEIINKTPKEELQGDFSAFWRTWDDLNNKHINKPFDSQTLIWGAIKGMVEAADDPYTTFLDPEENKSSDEVLSGEYQGIGAELTMKDEIVTVVSPFDGSPAKQAGIKPGDRILEVNKETTVGLSLYEVVNKIKGPKGSEVALTIAREGKEPFEVKINRDTITLDTLNYELKEDDVLYIRLSRFGEQTNNEWNQMVTDVVVKYPNVNNFILDLRGNPGGYLSSAVHVASEFMPQGVAVVEEFSDGTKTKIPTTHSGQFLNKNLVVLIDEGSASASEILSGTLREKADAVLVGKNSFGKGTVQEPIDYIDGSGLNVTIAKWLTPEGYWVHDVGLKPDIEVEITAEDVEAEVDPQLNKAIEVVKSME